MRVKIKTIYHLKRALGTGEVEVDLPEGTKVRGLLFRMIEMGGDKLSRRLFKPETGTLRPQIRLMVNGQDVGFLNGMCSPSLSYTPRMSTKYSRLSSLSFARVGTLVVIRYSALNAWF